jgi:hypothetical protein
LYCHHARQREVGDAPSSNEAVSKALLDATIAPP